MCVEHGNVISGLKKITQSILWHFLVLTDLLWNWPSGSTGAVHFFAAYPKMCVTPVKKKKTHLTWQVTGKKLGILLLLHVDGNMAQLVECHTSSLLKQNQFSGAARDFSPWVNFQCRLRYNVCTPPWSVHTLKILWSMSSPMDYGNTHTQKKKHISMHCRLGNATLSQLAFPGESNPNFP